MPEASIFTPDPSVVEPQNPIPSVPAIPQEVADLVGEGKKYKTVDEALRSVPHAQTHIQKLETELAEKNEALMKAKSVEDLLEEIKNSGLTPPVPAPQGQTTQNIDITKTVNEVVSQRLAAESAARIAQHNTNYVISAFQAKFGEKSEEEYIKLANESGLPIQALNKLAAQSPNAVLKLAGLSETTKNVSTPPKTGGTVNIEAFRTQQPAGQPASARVTGGKTSDLVSAWRAAKPTE